MDIKLLRHTLTEKLTAFVNQLSYNHDPREAVSTRKMDALQQEIYQIEQSLVEIATRPNRVIRKPQPLTEQQKIIDLAG